MTARVVVQHTALVHDVAVVLQHAGGVGRVVAEVLGNIGVGKALVDAVVVLVTDRGIGPFVDEGPGLVCDTHGAG